VGRGSRSRISSIRSTAVPGKRGIAAGGTDGRYEPLLGYVMLEKSKAAVDMVGHRLVPLKHLDLK
jgi:hypothetical protein